MIAATDQNVAVAFNNAVSEWGSLPYPQLSVVLVHLKFLAAVHQNHHWIAKGDCFYGDHQLFQRLYDSAVEEVDKVAERVVGLGTPDNTNLTLQTTQLLKMVQCYGATSTIPQSNELAKRSLSAEMNFLQVLHLSHCQMKELGTLTQGLDNLMQGIADVHESSVYLLKQRCRVTVPTVS